ncbi:MAG TPA: PilW family protein [Gammaproteobacteria bacterium]|nr:PilW family protein [Gammaproteobacteria bacterium]
MKMKRQQRGLSLVELMIAMLLGLILIAGVVEVYLSSRASYRLNRGLAQVQEKGRFATAFLVHDIRMAGYTGCSGGSPASVVSTLDLQTASDQFLYNFSHGLQGFDSYDGSTTWTPTIPTALTDSTKVHAIQGTDVVAVRTVQGMGVHISEAMPKSSAELKVNNVESSDLQPGDIVMLTDCSAAAVFQVTAVQTSADHIQHNTGDSDPGNSTKDLGQAFRIGSEVQKIATVTYFIGARDLSDTCASGTCGLYKKVGDGDPEELVSGVTDLQALYGVDTDGDLTPNQYVTADKVNDWNSVVSVKIAVLVESDDAATSKPATKPTYALLDTSVTPPNDMHMRKVFSDTIAIRNRVL